MYRVTLIPGDGNGPEVTSAARSYPSITVALRNELGLFANVRPIRNYPGVPSRYDEVDLIVFRENSEDLYVGRERMIDEGTAGAIRGLVRTEEWKRELERNNWNEGYKASVETRKFLEADYAEARGFLTGLELAKQ